jgi:hypothetical protein
MGIGSGRSPSEIKGKAVSVGEVTLMCKAGRGAALKDDDRLVAAIWNDKKLHSGLDVR